MSVYWDPSQQSSQLKSNFTKDADRAFDDFCKKFLNSSNGFFIAPDFKQTELKQIQTTNLFTSYNSRTNGDRNSSSKLAQKASQPIRALNVKNIKEVTRLDLDKKSLPKTQGSPTQLLNQQRIEVNNTRDILREKLVQSITKFQSQTTIDSKLNSHSNIDNLFEKEDKILQDLIGPKQESTRLIKNRSEKKLNEPYMYCKSNNNTMSINISPKNVECDEKNEITDLFNNPRAEFIVNPIPIENKKNLHSTYFGSLSINDFKHKLKRIDTLSQTYLKGKDQQNFSLSQTALNTVLSNSSLNLNVTYRNPNINKKHIEDHRKNFNSKNLNNSQIILNSTFDKLLNEYLNPPEKSSVKVKNNLNVSKYKYKSVKFLHTKIENQHIRKKDKHIYFLTKYFVKKE